MTIKEKTDREIIDSIINRALICHLACSRGNQPYIVPISFGYDGTSIYFHSGPAGKKTSILKENPRVCLTFETDLKIVKDHNNACDWNFHYSSVIADGQAKEITQLSEKAEAMNSIMEHYSGKSWTFPDNKLSKTTIWKIRLDTVSYKNSPSDN